MMFGSRLFQVGLAGCALLFCITQVFAEQQVVRKNIPVITLLVKKFSEFEVALKKALQEGNTTIINQCLSDDFEVRQANNPNAPIPRDKWIQDNLHKNISKDYMHQMAVRELGDVNIVSYLYHVDNKDILIVDIWKKQDNSNLLMARYTSS